MQSSLNQVFTSTAASQGEVTEYATSRNYAFGWQDQRPSVIDILTSAVSDAQQFWAERGMHPSIKAARGGVNTTIDYILKGGRFQSGRDAVGLDAGYYVTLLCAPYDFTAMAVVERIGPVGRADWHRFYNSHPDGRAAFVAAIEAGLTFSSCRDEDGHTAGFFIAHSRDEELIALYEKAGGTFRPSELEVLGRIGQARAVA